MIRVYRDSKEIPIHIYERIESTGDFFYMVKGYEYGDEINADIEELKLKFDEIVQDYILSINSKSIDIANYGIVYAGTLNIEELNRAKEIVIINAQSAINWEIQIDRLKQLDITDDDKKQLIDTCNVSRENAITTIKEFISQFKIPYKEDIEQQIAIFDSRISKIENNIAVAQKKIDDKPESVSNQEYDILQDVTFVERVLKIQIDVYKTSLYRLGLHKIEAVKEIESLIKQNSKNGRK